MQVLDVGAGDGRLAQALLAHRPDLTLEGVDVLVRPETAIPVRPFDGTHLPYADQSMDVVLLIDVLHHAEDGHALLAECARVARRAVVVKDHVRTGFLAGPTLAAMDWVGNARYGVRLPPSPDAYWTMAQWDAALTRAQLIPKSWRTPLGLYSPLVAWACERDLHCLRVLAHETPRDGQP